MDRDLFARPHLDEAVCIEESESAKKGAKFVLCHRKSSALAGLRDAAESTSRPRMSIGRSIPSASFSPKVPGHHRDYVIVMRLAPDSNNCFVVL